MTSKILVWGAGGYIGEAVAKSLRRAGFAVTGAIRDATKASRLETHEIRPLIVSNVSELSYDELCAYVAVIDTAGYQENASAALLERICVAAKKRGGPRTLFLFTSGIMTYGHAGDAQHHGSVEHWTVLDETVSPVDLEPIMQERKQFEDRVLSVGLTPSALVDAVVFRPGWVYGGNGGHYVDQFFKFSPMELTSGARIPVNGSGEKRYSWVHVEDLAAAYVAAVNASDTISGQLFNIASYEAPTVAEIRVAAARAAGRTECTRAHIDANQPVPTGEDAVRWRLQEATVIVSSKKAEQLLGWRALHVGFLAEMPIYYRIWSMTQQKLH